MATMQVSPQIDRLNLWVNSGETKEDAERLTRQSLLLKTLREVINQQAEPKNIDGENALPPAQVLQLPPPTIKKERVEKKEICKNGLLIASYFPFFGFVASNTCKIILAKKINSTAEPEKLTHLKERLNQYRIASIVSTLLTVALAISALVVGGILLGGALFFAGIGVAAAAAALAIALVTIDSVQYHRSKAPITKQQTTLIEDTKPKSPRKLEAEKV